jgi:hypothetical protein
LNVRYVIPNKVVKITNGAVGDAEPGLALSVRTRTLSVATTVPGAALQKLVEDVEVSLRG